MKTQTRVRAINTARRIKGNHQFISLPLSELVKDAREKLKAMDEEKENGSNRLDVETAVDEEICS